MRPGPIIRRGLVAVVVAAIVTTLLAALARVVGVDLEVDGERIPLGGVAFLTTVFSLVGVAIALAAARWSSRPAPRFLQVTVVLTAISLVPPVLVGDGAATVTTLVVLHLVPAGLVIAPLAASLQVRQPSA